MEDFMGITNGEKAIFQKDFMKYCYFFKHHAIDKI